MRTEIINIGAEILAGQTLNTHHQWIAQRLAECGRTVERQETIDDRPKEIVESARAALERSDLVITTGGLGPTSDDRTREALAAAFGFELREDPNVTVAIRGFFERRQRPLPESVLVQANVPVGGHVFQNEFGTAPGIGLPIDNGAKWLLMIPGPPRELRPMFLNQALPFINNQFPQPSAFASRILRSTGLGESRVQDVIESPLAPLIQSGLEVGYCARPGEVDIRLIARGPAARELSEQAREIVLSLLGPYIFTEDDQSLEAVVIELANAKGLTLATAESCTGGHIANRLTNVPGASNAFLAGFVTYHNTAKINAIGVSKKTLDAHGAVSEPVAKEMADGARRAANADFAISTTGIAGPDGGNDEKPVGLVYMGLATPTGTEVSHSVNASDRLTFKYLTAQQCLESLRRALIAIGPVD